jgi:hypothetical protein
MEDKDDKLNKNESKFSSSLWGEGLPTLSQKPTNQKENSFMGKAYEGNSIFNWENKEKTKWGDYDNDSDSDFGDSSPSFVSNNNDKIHSTSDLNSNRKTNPEKEINRENAENIFKNSSNFYNKQLQNKKNRSLGRENYKKPPSKNNKNEKQPKKKQNLSVPKEVHEENLSKKISKSSKKSNLEKDKAKSSSCKTEKLNKESKTLEKSSSTNTTPIGSESRKNFLIKEKQKNFSGLGVSFVATKKKSGVSDIYLNRQEYKKKIINQIRCIFDKEAHEYEKVCEINGLKTILLSDEFTKKQLDGWWFVDVFNNKLSYDDLNKLQRENELYSFVVENGKLSCKNKFVLDFDIKNNFDIFEKENITILISKKP